MFVRLASGIALIATACAWTPAAAQSHGSASLWIEAGPSVDTYDARENGASGYALAGGVALGRALAFTVGVAFEHYPSDADPQPGVVLNPGPIAARREGGGDKRVTSFTPGIRWTMSQARVQPFLDASLGFAQVSGEHMRYVDAATGVTVYPSSRFEWSGLAGTVGLGLRSNRRQRFDGMIGARWRLYTEGFEGSSGSSFQAGLGLIVGLGER